MEGEPSASSRAHRSLGHLLTYLPELQRETRAFPGVGLTEINSMVGTSDPAATPPEFLRFPLTRAQSPGVPRGAAGTWGAWWNRTSESIPAAHPNGRVSAPTSQSMLPRRARSFVMEDEAYGRLYGCCYDNQEGVAWPRMIRAKSRARSLRLSFGSRFASMHKVAYP